MKTIALSDRTSKVYATGINVLILAIVATVILLNLKVTAVIVVASVLGAISLFVAVFYLIVIFTAKVTVGDGKLTERFVNKTYTADISKATTVMTVQRTVGHTVTRVIGFAGCRQQRSLHTQLFLRRYKGIPRRNSRKSHCRRVRTEIRTYRRPFAV